MSLNLLTKVAIVTGGTRGIGQAICYYLRTWGARVIDISRTGFKQADLSKREELFDLIPRCDILINNASAQHFARFRDFSVIEWDADIELDLTAPFVLSQQAARHMLRQGSGKIINIASIAGIEGTRGVIAYSVAKAGLIQLTKCMSNELAPYNIQVNAIAPGYIDTDMLGGAFRDEDHKEKIRKLIPAQRFGIPSDIIPAVEFLLKADYVTGTTIPVDGGWLSRR